MKKIIYICFLLIILMVLQGCSSSSVRLEPVVTYEPNINSKLQSNNIKYTQNIVESQISKTSYAYSYKNIYNANVNVILEFYVSGKLVNKINKESTIVSDLDKDKNKGLFALTIVRPILQDDKNFVNWILEHNNNIVLMSYGDFFPKLSKYNVDIEKEVKPEKGVSTPVITFYANENKSVDLETRDNNKIKGTNEFMQFYLDNYKYVYFLKFNYN